MTGAEDIGLDLRALCSASHFAMRITVSAQPILCGSCENKSGCLLVYPKLPRRMGFKCGGDEKNFNVVLTLFQLPCDL